MLLRYVFILIACYPMLGYGQSVVIDIEYQQNTTYQWTSSYINDGSLEYLGAEDRGDWMEIAGVDAYSESKNIQYIGVTMNTSNRGNKKLPFYLTIDSLNKEVVTTSARIASFQNTDPLEIDDLEIKGVINQFQKIEIDSIDGVDSLHEKNRVFRLLDEIHRSWSYPTDTLEIGKPIVKTSEYGSSVNNTGANISKTYTLQSFENNIARIGLEYLVYSDKEDESGEILDSRIYDGKGTGLLLYDASLKQVVLYEYTLDVNATYNAIEMAVESIQTSSYRRTMNVIN